jgi:hypothetical protein
MFQAVRKRGSGVIDLLLWREKYTDAMLELNPQALPAKIAAAETAIKQRIVELEQWNNDSQEEMWALNDALRGLRVLAEAERALSSGRSEIRPRQEAS